MEELENFQLNRTNKGSQLNSSVALENVNLDAPKKFEHVQLLDKDAHWVPQSTKTVWHVIMFIFISLNDGMLSGYMASLMAIFTERKVPSYRRFVLNVAMTPVVFRVIFSPIVDKYFSRRIGRRKTYLLPCKLIATLFYLIMSFHIQTLIDDNSVVLMGSLFLIPCLVQCFENSAVFGFRLEYFGKRHAGHIGAVNTISMTFGLAIGIQIFTALNSPKVCRTYLGLPDKILSHEQFLRMLAAANFLGFCIVVCIKEHKRNYENLAKTLTFVHVYRAFIEKKLVRKLVGYQVLFSITLLAMRITCTQYYILNGLVREHVIVPTIIMVPLGFLANMLWVKYINSGHLVTKAWAQCVCCVFIMSLHIPNIYFFNKETNYTRTLICYGIIYGLDTVFPWGTFQNSLVNLTASTRYGSSWTICFSSSLSGSRVLVVMSLNSVLDFFNVYTSFGFLCILQLIINLSLKKEAERLDEVNTVRFKQEFEGAIESYGDFQQSEDEYVSDKDGDSRQNDSGQPYERKVPKRKLLESY